MSLDHTMLQICRSRKRFYQLFRMLNEKAVDPHTLSILKAYDAYFKLEPDCPAIPLEDGFKTWFFLTRKALAENPEAKAIITAVFAKAAQQPSEFAERVIVKQLLQADLAVKTTEVMDRYHAGEDIDPAARLNQFYEEYCVAMEVSQQKFDFVELDEDLFAEDEEGGGLRPRWACLQNFMRPWRGGDFIIFASRPDAGKTSAIADNITYMAPQVAASNAAQFVEWEQAQAPEEDKPKPRCILWLNNEGPGKRILKRVVQAAFGIPMSEIIVKQQKGTLWGEYEILIGGDRHVIKVKDIHMWTNTQVEELIKATNPALVVYDMIDNIQFAGLAGNGGTRTDQLLEAMYAWGRNMAVIHDHVGMATSQTSADAADKSYPAMYMLKDSKTGKQGACDAIIMMGIREDNPLEEAVRWISTPKNKLAVEGMGKSPKEEMIFNYATSRFLGRTDVTEQEQQDD